LSKKPSGTASSTLRGRKKRFAWLETMRTYNAKISYLLSILFSETSHEPGLGQLVLRAIEEIEKTRRAIVTDTRLLPKPE
jgi:hypothetical protein